MGTRTDIDEQVFAVIARALKVPRERLTLGTRLRDDLGADSLDTTEIVMELEAQFGISLNTRETDIKTVAEVVEYMKESIEAAEQAMEVAASTEASV